VGIGAIGHGSPSTAGQRELLILLHLLHLLLRGLLRLLRHGAEG
jgi:hypothetical protein